MAIVIANKYNQELDRSIQYTFRLSNNDICAMELCCRRINIGFLEIAPMVAASVFDYHELVDGVFINGLRAVDNVDVTRSIGYMGFVFVFTICSLNNDH